MFFVIEGIDGAGKSTQAARLREWLAGELGGERVLLTREPGGWEGSDAWRECALSGKLSNNWSEFFFFMMDRCEHASRVIKPALEAGRVVVCDRYSPSTSAYQLFAQTDVTRETAAYMARISELVGLPEPDAVFLLDMEENEAARRVARRAESMSDGNAFDARGADYFKRVHDAYETVMAASRGRWIKIDASRPENDVFSALRDNISDIIGMKK
ncbi:thymidylate kinase [Synergistales bacterium]|nr:thymidylate kinase [Synergistales bacterium]